MSEINWTPLHKPAVVVPIGRLESTCKGLVCCVTAGKVLDVQVPFCDCVARKFLRKLFGPKLGLWQEEDGYLLVKYANVAFVEILRFLKANGLAVSSFTPIERRWCMLFTVRPYCRVGFVKRVDDTLAQFARENDE